MEHRLIPLEPNVKFATELLSEGNLLEVIIKFHGDLDEIARQLNGVAERLNENYAILTIPLSSFSNLFTVRGVEYFEMPKSMAYMMQRSMEKSCVPPVQRERSFGLRGKGVLVAIIDSGIDYTHPDFRNEDGSSRILYLWDQSLEGTPPPDFNGGRLFTKEELDAALKSPNPYSVVPSRDVIGHGTAVAGIAAGNGRSSDGQELGVAPESELIVIKLQRSGAIGFALSTAIMRGVKFALDTAQALERPVSINISNGTNDGAHDGNSLFEQYLNSVSERWKCAICVATGNEGSSGHHFFGVAAEKRTNYAEMVVGENIRSLYITLWKNFVDSIEYELIAPSGQSTGNIAATQSVTLTVLDRVQVSVLYGQPNHYTTSQEVYFSLNAIGDSIPQGLWRLSYTGVSVVDGRFDIWLPMTDVVTRQTAFLVPNIQNTITIPATAYKVISVGAYNSLLNTSVDFSGRGMPYGRYGQKPDLVAPGVNVLTTKTGGGYDRFTGTSIATPFVTGSAALMLEWGDIKGNDPFLYGERIKAFLCHSAARSFPRAYPNPEWGYGALNLCDTMGELVIFNQRGGAFR
ncbi:S8 family peptidase [Oscillospiraceae bacterium LTW-04]|nr:S8 family peptidase [Oscillospiraceae bacterium MB24-C1]